MGRFISLQLSVCSKDLLAECETMYEVKAVYNDQNGLWTLKWLGKKLYAVKESPLDKYRQFYGRSPKLCRKR